jgi:hypothetical protein
MSTKYIKTDPIKTDSKKHKLPKIHEKNIKKIILFSLVFVTVLLQIGIKIWNYKILINYYYKLNNNFKLDNSIIYEDYKYLFYLAVTNIFFTIIAILYCLLALYIYIYQYSLYKIYKTEIQYSITILGILSFILSVTSSMIRSNLKDKYIKYLNENCDTNEKIIFYMTYTSLGFGFFSLIIKDQKF